MGIREEIEKLRVPEYWVAAKERNQKIDQVLSILDEHLGKCVGEAEWRAVYDQDQLEDGRDWILLEMDMPEEFLESIHKLNPGDHISIYARKGK